VSVTLRTATAAECRRLWPAINNERIFLSAEAFYAYHEAAPWRVRVAEKGITSLLGAWREHLPVLALRGVWCAERHVPAVCADAEQVAAEHGFTQLMSPLLPSVLLDGYRRAGMRVHQRVVAIQGVPELVMRADPPLDVRFRPATADDLGDLAALDAACFDPFWRYGAPELAELIRDERAVVAQAGSGDLIGYTLATVSRGAATMGRLAVAPAGRRCGIGRALVSDVARWAVDAGALTLGLCTQDDNVASRALYAACGLHEIDDRYALAIGDVGAGS